MIKEVETEDDVLELLADHHYGMYGANCIAIGKFDAGTCWLCELRAKLKKRKEETARWEKHRNETSQS